MNIKNIAFHKLSPYLWQAINVSVSLAAFTFILLNRSPNFLRSISMALRTGFGLVIPAAALLLYLSFRTPNKIGNLVSMTFTMCLFAMPLAGLWASGQTQTTVLNGIIPMVDAGSYYIDALQLLDGDKFSTFSARRPLFSGLLAVALALTGRNLMFALAILTAIAAFACYFTAREIQRTHGAAAASFTLLVIFLFYRAHSGVSMTENLGVALGTLGFGFLWRGAANRNMLFIWIGLFTTTLGLNARAGTFFMLPLLILWSGNLFRKTSLVSWRAVFFSSSAVVFGFMLTFIFTRLVADSSGVPFGNFSYTLYGLASGGNSWAYVLNKYPELLVIQEPEKTKQIYQLAFDLILSNPLLTIKGMLFNWSMLFSDSWYNIYSYVGGDNWHIILASRWGMYLLSLTGLFAWFRDRKDPLNSLLAVSILGVFISVPFLPPTDAYRMRPYAASIVVMAALPAIGLNFIIRKAGIKLENAGEGMNDLPSLPVLFNFILIAVMFIGPILLMRNSNPQTLKPVGCLSKESESTFIRFDEGNYINIKKQNQPFLDWMPDYHIGLFRRNLRSIPWGDTRAWASVVEPPVTLFYTMDLKNKYGVWVALKTDTPPAAGYYQICGKHGTDQREIFYVDEIIPINP